MLLFRKMNFFQRKKKYLETTIKVSFTFEIQKFLSIPQNDNVLLYSWHPPFVSNKPKTKKKKERERKFRQYVLGKRKRE